MKVTVPDGWTTSNLGELLEFKNGLNKAKEYFGSGTPIINFMDVLNHPVLREKDVKGMVTLSSDEIKRFSAKKGDIFFTRTSETIEDIGTSTALVEDIPNAVFSGFVLRGRPLKNDFDDIFKGYCFKAAYVRKQIISKATYTTRALTNGRALSSVSLLLPPIDEQKRIGEAFEAVDSLISSLQALMQKKQAIKSGLMQQLLTGESRLPGFEDKWETTSWGEVTSRCVSGATPSRSRPEFFKGSVNWVTSTELKYKAIYTTPQHISEEAVESANLTIWPSGTFLMAITGLEAAGTRGSCGILGRPAATNQSCMAIIPNKRLETGFLYHYYVLKGDELAFKYCQGTKQQSYTAGIVKTLPISLPTDLNEQKAIAQILDDAQEEIDQIYLRLQKLEQVKEGMLQQLLTGRTRLLNGDAEK